jgi:nucleoside-diphosphate-sugar epimerase
MKILITGIHGFVGTNMVEAFKETSMIFGLDIITLPNPGVSKSFAWNDLEHIPSVDVIIHLAGKAHDLKKVSSEQEYYDINVGLTKKIFNHFLNSSTRKFIYFSSVKAAADIVGHSPLTEQDFPSPQTHYGKSKLEAEKHILHSTIPTSRKVYIVRPAMIHGPGNKGNLNILYSLISRGIPYPLGKYENKRSFTSIRNLLYIINKLVTEEIEPGTYNICDDESLSTNELVRLIAHSINRPPRLLKIPKILIDRIAHAGSFLRLPFNSEVLMKLTESYVVSNLKIKNALSIESLVVNAREGMVETFRSFQS